MKDNQKSRVLVIGLDGATFDVLLPLIKNGSLPVLSKLVNQGSYGKLRSTIPPLTPPAWTTFMTGKNPGKHGIIDFFSLTNNIIPNNSSNIRGLTLWNVLSQQCYKVGIVNVPMTFPPSTVNGFMITGMLTPSEKEDYTYPKKINLGNYRIDLEYFLPDKMGKHEYLPKLKTLVQEITNLMEERAKTVCSLFIDKFDFFMVVFTGTDRLGHFFWPYHKMDKHSFSDHDVEIFNKVFDFYQKLDMRIGEIIKCAGDNLTVILMSDHGMGPSSDRVVYINQWLKNNQYLKILPITKSWKNSNYWLSTVGLSRDKLAYIKNFVPTIKKIQQIENKFKRLEIPIDHKKSIAYFKTIYMSTGGIFIEKDYKQDPDNYNQICEKIIEELLSIKDPLTNDVVVENAFRKHEIYRGEFLEYLPDIILILKPRYRTNHRLGSNAIIKQRKESRQDSKVLGDHRSEGIFIISGKNISINCETLSGLNIEDLMPTILYLMGATIPDDLDGKIIKQAISPLLTIERKPTFKTFSLKNDLDKVQLSTEQNELIINRLRDLGYMD